MLFRGYRLPCESLAIAQDPTASNDDLFPGVWNACSEVSGLWELDVYGPYCRMDVRGDTRP